MARVKIGNRYFDAVSGIAVNDENGDKALYSKPSWSENTKTKAGYIENRPFFREDESEGSLLVLDSTKTYLFPGLTTETADIFLSQVDDVLNLQDPFSLIGCEISYDGGVTKHTIVNYIKTAYELELIASSEETVCVIVDGPLVGLNSTVTAIYLMGASSGIPLMLYANKKGVLDQDASPIGLYVNFSLSTSWNYYNYKPIIINEDYLTFFQNLRNPIHIMRSTVADIEKMDFSNFEPGDIILGVLDQ